MANKDDLITRAMQQIPDLDAVTQALDNDPHAALNAVRPAKPQSDLGLESMEGPDEGLNLLVAGNEALKKVRAHGTKAKLSDAEALGLEAVILTTGRPAILVQKGTFAFTPGWDELEPHRKAIEDTLPSVGRIDVVVQGQHYQIGTGFLVGKKTIMTNRHVAKAFSEQKKDAWSLVKLKAPSVDWLREKDNAKSSEFRIKRVLGIHDDVDLALLEVETAAVKGKAKLPDPLEVSQKPSKKSEHVFTVGYPMRDNEGVTPLAVMNDIFGGAFGVKRLQPGWNTGAVNPKEFKHDCSTLGGNSGSCVFSLDSGRVVGLHYSGSYKKTNKAVALWKLTNDPLVKKHVEFF